LFYLGLAAAEATQYCSQNANALCCRTTGNTVGAAGLAQQASSTAAVSQPTVAEPPAPPPVEQTPTSQSKVESGPSSGTEFSPLYLGLAAGGVALLAIAGAALLLFRRGRGKGASPKNVPDAGKGHESYANVFKSPGSGSAGSGAPPVGHQGGPEIFEALYQYQATLLDELSLSKYRLT
jgi:hypothetical protein